MSGSLFMSGRDAAAPAMELPVTGEPFGKEDRTTLPELLVRH